MTNQKNIARVDMIGVCGDVVESLYFSEMDALLGEIGDNINTGRSFKVEKLQDIHINMDQFY